MPRGARVVASDSPSSSSTSFVDAARLRRSAEIAAVRSDGMRLGQSLFAMRARRNGMSAMRLAVTAPTSLGRAVTRNRARRRVREALRVEIGRLTGAAGHDLVVVARAPAAEAPYPALRAAVRVALAALGRGKDQ